MEAANAQFDLDLFLLLTNTHEDRTKTDHTPINATPMYNAQVADTSVTPVRHDPQHHSGQLSPHPNQEMNINQTTNSAYCQSRVLSQEMARQEFQAAQYHQPGQSMTAESNVQAWAAGGCPTPTNFCLVARTTVPTPVYSSLMINTAQNTPYGINSTLPTDNSSSYSSTDSQISQISNAFDHPRGQHEGQSSLYYSEVDFLNQSLYTQDITQSPVFSHTQPHGHSSNLRQSSIRDSTSHIRMSLLDSSIGNWDSGPSHHSWQLTPQIPTNISELSKFPGVDDCAHRVRIAESIANNLQYARKSFEATEAIEIPEDGQRSHPAPKFWKKRPIPGTIYSMQRGNMNNPNSLFLPASAICGGFLDDMRNKTMALGPLPNSRFFPANSEILDNSRSLRTIPRSSAALHSPIRGFVNATSADYTGNGRMADREDCDRPTKKPRTQDIRKATILQAQAEPPMALVNPITSQQIGSCDLPNFLLKPSENVEIPSDILPSATTLLALKATSTVLDSPYEPNQSLFCSEGILKSEIDSLFEEQLLDTPDIWENAVDKNRLSLQVDSAVRSINPEPILLNQPVVGPPQKRF